MNTATELAALRAENAALTFGLQLAIAVLDGEPCANLPQIAAALHRLLAHVERDPASAAEPAIVAGWEALKGLGLKK